jgi:hypothetical protein
MKQLDQSHTWVRTVVTLYHLTDSVTLRLHGFGLVAVSRGFLSKNTIVPCKAHRRGGARGGRTKVQVAPFPWGTSGKTQFAFPVLRGVAGSQKRQCKQESW